MTADIIIGERVHQCMWRERIPQRKVAEVLDIHQASLSKKLRGERNWTMDELLAVARFLDVPVTDLLPAADYEPVPVGRGRGRTTPSIRTTPQYARGGQLLAGPWCRRPLRLVQGGAA